MNRIDDMVKELCPDGFERVPLGSIATQYVDPVRVRPDATYVNLGVRWYGEGAFAREPKTGKDIKAATLYRVKPGQFIYNRMFVTEGAFGLVTADLSNGVVSNEFPAYDLDPTRVLPDWLLLKFQDPSTVGAAAAETTGGTKSRRRWKEDQFEAFVIDLPPILVQREIMRILSTFSELQVELKAELELRLLQYAHYRNSLLAFPEGAEIRWATLPEISTNLDSQRKPVTKSAREAGQIPYYGASGIVDYVSDYIFDGDYLLISEDGANLLARSTPIAFSISGKTWVNNHAHVLKFATYAERRFVEIYLNSIDLAPFVTGGAQPKLNQANLNKIPIPMPPVSEQERIVTILDKFDLLVNDPSRGLPAELKARRKQYEYYRDRLLTFKELAA